MTLQPYIFFLFIHFTSSFHSTNFVLAAFFTFILPWTSPFHHQLPRWLPMLPLDIPSTSLVASPMQLIVLFHILFASPLLFQAPIAINFSPITRERAGIKPPNLIFGRSYKFFFFLSRLISKSIIKNLCWVVKFGETMSIFSKCQQQLTCEIGVTSND